MPVEWAQEVEVCAYSQELDQQCVVPRADGSYVYPGLIGSMTFVFIPTHRSGLLTQYYDHVGTLKEATYRVISRESVVRGINANLTEGGVVAGTVTAAGSAPLAEVQVCAVSLSTPAAKSCAETGASGDYELRGLPSGHYRVGYRGYGSSAAYQPSYYEDAFSPAESTLVAVTAGGAVVLDAELHEGASISGFVTEAASGAALEGVAVCLFAVGESVARNCTESGGGGDYAFRGLPSGDYQVGFFPGSGGYQVQYYDGVPNRFEARAVPLLAPATAEGADGALFSPPPPSAPLLPPSVTAPITAAPPTIGPPQPKKVGCEKPKRKKKVKGKVRCVRPAKPRGSKKQKAHRGKRKGSKSKDKTGSAGSTPKRAYSPAGVKDGR